MIRQNFNADWTVEKGDGNSRMNSFLGNTQTKTVHLPYDAMIHEARTPDTKNGAQTGFYPGGEYIFQKHFTAPQAWQGKPVSLVFEGVYQTALVYLNGWLLTRNVNGYAEFTVEAGPYLKYGADNLLKVIADNSLEPNSRWYTGSGVYRPVRLLVGNKVYLPQDTVRITTREADEGFALLDVTAQVQSASTVTERVTLQQTICREGTAVLTDRQNLLLQPGESRTVSFRYCVDSPALWSPENPNLYTSTMQVLEGEEELDREETGFGIRTLSIDAAHGVRINGQTVKLRGACIHHDNGILGAATLPDAEERRIRQLKEAGFNAIRSSHHPAGRALLDACDRYGVLVMDELSDVWNVRKNPYDYALYFEQDWKPTIQKMVAKDYNHPSVILYCVGNEISEAGSESGAETNRRLCNTFRELDPTRYTTNALNGLMAAGYRLREIMGDVMRKFPAQPGPSGGDGGGSNALNSFMSLMSGESGTVPERCFSGPPYRGRFYRHLQHALCSRRAEGCGLYRRCVRRRVHAAHRTGCTADPDSRPQDPASQRRGCRLCDDPIRGRKWHRRSAHQAHPEGGAGGCRHSGSCRQRKPLLRGALRHPRKRDL